MVPVAEITLVPINIAGNATKIEGAFQSNKAVIKYDLVKEAAVAVKEGALSIRYKAEQLESVGIEINTLANSAVYLLTSVHANTNIDLVTTTNKLANTRRKQQLRLGCL